MLKKLEENVGKVKNIMCEQNGNIDKDMYMCIFHYFNYYLPDFVTAICRGFSLFIHFWIFVLISLNAITNHLWNLCS